MKDMRRFPRRAVNFEVNVTLSSQTSCIYKAMDVSQGGMYIAAESAEQPCIGELLHIKLIEQPRLNETIPYEDAVVVHKAKHGFGLSFVGMNGKL